MRPDSQADLIVHTETPLNAEPALHRLGESFITPTPLFFVRSHAPTPVIDTALYRLKIDGLVGRPLALSLDEVRRLPAQTITATLQCAGNRRSQLIDLAPIPDETPWQNGAIGTAVWTGARLIDVLSAAGVRDEAAHIAFVGLDAHEKDGLHVGLGGSIPRVSAADALIVYAMNGEPLTPDHGYPLRMIVPGVIGARSVKWLDRITAQAEPSENYYQRRAYRLFAPQVDEAGADWDAAPMLHDLPVNAAITTPGDGDRLHAGTITVSGYAVTSGGRSIARVDVSADGGASWHTANLGAEVSVWAWRWWQIAFDLAPGSYQLVARAVDSAANSQPEQVSSVWNWKGYMNNAWHRVAVTVEAGA